MKLHNEISMIEDRKSKLTPVNDLLSAIQVVDITTIDLCNRTCDFCPRANPSTFPNRNLKMTASGADIIAYKLSEIGYKGTIAISGFGENLLNPEIVGIIDAFRKHLPEAFIECNTNGDPLLRSLKIFDSGLDRLNINLYDGEAQVKQFDKLLESIDDSQYTYRAHWSENNGIIFNNRSGLVDWYDDGTELPINKPCHYPFYKLYVDWNGDVLFCANDWGRERVVGNLFNQSIEEVWMSSEMKKVRKRLINSDRSMSPCNKCNVKGTLVGKESFEVFKEYYEDNSDGINKTSRIDMREV